MPKLNFPALALALLLAYTAAARCMMAAPRRAQVNGRLQGLGGACGVIRGLRGLFRAPNLNAAALGGLPAGAAPAPLPCMLHAPPTSCLTLPATEPCHPRHCRSLEPVTDATGEPGPVQQPIQRRHRGAAAVPAAWAAARPAALHPAADGPHAACHPAPAGAVASARGLLSSRGLKCECAGWGQLLATRRCVPLPLPPLTSARPGLAAHWPPLSSSRPGPPACPPMQPPSARTGRAPNLATTRRAAPSAWRLSSRPTERPRRSPSPWPAASR